MAITASMVKELRERTGAGMMDCKKALGESDGDMDAAIESLRKKGAASADKKAGRIAAEGIIASHVEGDTGVLVEINSETDFVAKEPSFIEFAASVASTIASAKPADVEALSGESMSGATVDEARRNLIAKIGENIGIRRFEIFDVAGGASVQTYLHGARIGVMVESTGGGDDLGRDLAMHIAASNPMCVAESDVSAETLESEKKIFLAQAEESGKPPEIAEKMVTGRIKKFVKENTLLGQPFVKDPDTSVEDLLKGADASVARFVRFEVGEGIEKAEDDFVAEVMAQAKGD